MPWADDEPTVLTDRVWHETQAWRRETTVRFDPDHTVRLFWNRDGYNDQSYATVELWATGWVPIFPRVPAVMLSIKPLTYASTEHEFWLATQEDKVALLAEARKILGLR